jgi:hypothetical protein
MGERQFEVDNKLVVIAADTEESPQPRTNMKTLTKLTLTMKTAILALVLFAPVSLQTRKATIMCGHITATTGHSCKVTIRPILTATIYNNWSTSPNVNPFTGRQERFNPTATSTRCLIAVDGQQ